MTEHDDETAITHADFDAQTYIGAFHEDARIGRYTDGAPTYWSTSGAQGQRPQEKKRRTSTILALIGAVAVLTFFGVRLLLPSSSSTAEFGEETANGQSHTPAAKISMPANTASQCLPNNGIKTPPANIRMAAKDNVSCGYAQEIVKTVKQAHQQNPGATRFEVKPYSSYEKETVPLSCVTNDAMAHCTGGKHVDVYVMF